MTITEKTVFYLIVAAIITTVMSHFLKRELERRYPIQD